MTIIKESEITTPEGKVSSKVRELTKGLKFRIEAKMQIPGMPKQMEGMESIIIYDGKDTWMISSIMGKKKLSKEEERQYQMEKNYWDLVSEEAKNVKTEIVSKRECYVVELKEKSESSFTRMWLDKKSLLLTKAEMKGSKKEGTLLLVYSDFRKIKGEWEFPYTMIMYVNGNVMSTSVVKSLEINKGISDDLFNSEKVQVKGPTMQEMMVQKGLEGEEVTIEDEERQEVPISEKEVKGFPGIPTYPDSNLPEKDPNDFNKDYSGVTEDGHFYIWYVFNESLQKEWDDNADSVVKKIVNFYKEKLKKDGWEYIGEDNGKHYWVKDKEAIAISFPADYEIEYLKTDSKVAKDNVRKQKLIPIKDLLRPFQ